MISDYSEIYNKLNNKLISLETILKDIQQDKFRVSKEIKDAQNKLVALEKEMNNLNIKKEELFNFRLAKPRKNMMTYASLRILGICLVLVILIKTAIPILSLINPIGLQIAVSVITIILIMSSFFCGLKKVLETTEKYWKQSISEICCELNSTKEYQDILNKIKELNTVKVLTNCKIKEKEEEKKKFMKNMISVNKISVK